MGVKWGLFKTIIPIFHTERCNNNMKNRTVTDAVKANLVAVAQVAVALPAVGTGAAQAGGGLRGRGLGAHRRALVVAADEFGLG